MGANVDIEDAGPVRYVRFSRPAKLNAFRRDDLIAAAQAVSDAGPEVAVIVFTGAGDRAFSAGMDIDTFLGIVNDPTTARHVIGAVKHLLDTVRTCELVTLAAVRGYCLGAAFELALVCDLRVATPESRLGLPEINLGLPCILDSALLQQYVGLARAKHIMLTGEMYLAEQMLDWGVLNDVVPADRLNDHIAELADRMAAKPRLGIASQKRLFETWQNKSLRASNDASLDEIERVFLEPKTKEIVEEAAARF